MGILSGLTNLFTGGVVDGVSKIIGQFVTDPKDQLTANLALAKIASDYQTALLNKDGELAVQQASVVITEANSDSWLARNWRPITMLVFVFIIVWNFIIIGTVGAFVPTIHAIEIPPDMWGLLKLGIGGYIGARTVEKGIDTVSAALVVAKK